MHGAKRDKDENARNPDKQCEEKKSRCEGKHFF